MKSDFDVIIIGASVAGSSAAYSLASKGVKVALLDKQVFPRAKPCGEGLSTRGINYFDQLGLKSVVESLPHRPFHGYTIESGGKRNTIKNATADGIGIERFLLDHALIRAVASLPTATVFEDWSVRDVKRELFWSVHSDRGKLTAPYIIVADGANSRIARRLGATHRTSGSPRFGARMILQGSTNPNTEQVTVIVDDGFETYCTPLGGGRMNVNVLGGPSAIQYFQSESARRKIDALLQSKFSFKGELTGPILGGGPFGVILRECNAEGIFLVGDAIEMLDPLGGMGMTHAIGSAITASDVIYKIFSGEVPASSAQGAYLKQRDAVARPLRGFTRLTRQVLRHLAHRKIFETLSRGSLLRTIKRGLDADGPMLSQVLLSIIGTSFIQ